MAIYFQNTYFLLGDTKIKYTPNTPPIDPPILPLAA